MISQNNNTQFSRNKILAHLDVLDEYVKKGQLDSPITIELDLTNKCNHDCPGCTGFRMQGGLDSYITTDDAQKILKDIYECGVKAVTFTGGGDPTMHKDFDSLVKFAAKLGLEVGLISNGLSLHEKHLSNLIPFCKWIRISWDAATPALHDEIHYNGDLDIKMGSENNFWKVIDNTRMLVSYKQKNHFDTTIGCAFLVGPSTKNEIVEFARLASECKVDYCQYRPFHYLEHDEEYEKRMMEAQSLYNTKKFKVLFSEFKFESMRINDVRRKYKICHGSHFVAHIAANYKIYVCCHLMNNDFACIGDLKSNTFGELWKKNALKVINNIDVDKCLPLCRNDSANRIIDVLKNNHAITHSNFL